MYDNGYFNVIYIFVCIYNFLCYVVIVNNVIKNINEDGFYFWVFEDDVESLFYMFGISGIVNIKEVGRFIIRKFDNIYSCYG